jgi:hypothetical protein
MTELVIVGDRQIPEFARQMLRFARGAEALPRGSLGVAARAQRHAPTNINGTNVNGTDGRGSLSVIFLSVSLAGCAGDPGRVKMLDNPGVVRRTSRFLWCF